MTLHVKKAISFQRKSHFVVTWTVLISFSRNIAHKIFIKIIDILLNSNSTHVDLINFFRNKISSNFLFFGTLMSNVALKWLLLRLKGSVSVISYDPPRKKGNALSS